MSKEEIINKANTIIENHRELYKLMILDIVELIEGLLDLFKQEKEKNEERKERVLNLENKIIRQKRVIKKLENKLDQEKDKIREKIEDEIDIQEIEEINYYDIISAVEGKTEENINNELAKHSLIINKLRQAVKQLDKQINNK